MAFNFIFYDWNKFELIVMIFVYGFGYRIIELLSDHERHTERHWCHFLIGAESMHLILMSPSVKALNLIGRDSLFFLVNYIIYEIRDLGLPLDGMISFTSQIGYIISKSFEILGFIMRIGKDFDDPGILKI